jgi:hypothetical protein
LALDVSVHHKNLRLPIERSQGLQQETRRFAFPQWTRASSRLAGLDVFCAEPVRQAQVKTRQA